LEDWNIIILDGIVGSQTAVLSGHTSDVRSLAFSPDGISLVSGGDDMTIKLWDVQTGGVIKTFHGHTGWVYSVSISADCTTIASGSSDNTLHLWDIRTEECHYVIEQQSEVVLVRFSPIDPQYLISRSGSDIWHWNINTHKTNPISIDHQTNHAIDIAFSPDGTQFVSSSARGIVVVQNCGSGEITAKVHTTHSWVPCCCFSPNAKLIAVVVRNTICVYDTSSDPHPIKIFVGHSGSIISLVFSSISSLISASNDGSVRFWQMNILPTSSIVTDLTPTPLVSSLVNQPTKFWKNSSPSIEPAMANLEATSPGSNPIMSVTLQAKDGIIISSGLDRVVRTWDILTGLCKASFQIPAKDPRLSDARLVNSRLIFIWYMDEKIHIWDIEKREVLETVYVAKPDVHRIKISGDGSKVFCLFGESISAWSILTGEVVGEVEHVPFLLKSFLTVDDSRVWAYSSQSELLGWDFGITGSSPVQLSQTNLLHPSNTKLWEVSQSRVKDALTGKVIFQLAGRFATPFDLQWDGQYLVAGYWSGEILILDLNHILS